MWFQWRLRGSSVTKALYLNNSLLARDIAAVLNITEEKLVVRNPRGLHELDLLDDRLSCSVRTMLSYRAEMRASSLRFPILASTDDNNVQWNSTEVVGCGISHGRVKEKLEDFRAFENMAADFTSDKARTSALNTLLRTPLQSTYERENDERACQTRGCGHLF